MHGYIWQDCPDTGRSTGAYNIFYQGGTIDHGTNVTGPVAQPSAESDYNASVLLPVSGKSCQLESEEAIKWFLVLILACLKRSFTGTSFKSAYYFRPKVLLSLMHINKCTNTSKCTLPILAENFANLCTEKLNPLF